MLRVPGRSRLQLAAKECAGGSNAIATAFQIAGQEQRNFRRLLHSPLGVLHLGGIPTAIHETADRIFPHKGFQRLRVGDHIRDAEHLGDFLLQRHRGKGLLYPFNIFVV